MKMSLILVAKQSQRYARTIVRSGFVLFADIDKQQVLIANHAFERLNFV